MKDTDGFIAARTTGSGTAWLTAELALAGFTTLPQGATDRTIAAVIAALGGTAAFIDWLGKSNGVSKQDGL